MRALAVIAFVVPLAAIACSAFDPQVGPRLGNDAGACEPDEYVDAAYAAPALDAGCGGDT